MTKCNYEIDNVCTNKGCIFYQEWAYDSCPLCEFNPKNKDVTNELDPRYDLYGKEQKTMGEKVVIEGVGKDAEIVVNENGGKQSKSPMAMHLIDPEFLYKYYVIRGVKNPYIGEAIHSITVFMANAGHKYFLLDALKAIDTNYAKQIRRIATVLQEGAEKYEPNNWRLIPQEEHINHALIHLFAAELGDTQDNHIDHALTRIMMAYATKPSPNFSYTKHIKKVVA